MTIEEKIAADAEVYHLRTQLATVTAERDKAVAAAAVVAAAARMLREVVVEDAINFEEQDNWECVRCGQRGTGGDCGTGHAIGCAILETQWLDAGEGKT